MKRGFLKNAKATRPLNPISNDSATEPTRQCHNRDDDPSPNPRPQQPYAYGSKVKVKETQHTGSGSSSSKTSTSNVYTTLPGLNDPDGSTECVITPTGLQTLLSTPGYPQRVLRPPHQERSYEIRESGTHGLGAFATRDIQTGEMILSERPLIIARATFEGNVAYVRSLPEDERGRAMLEERERLMRPVVDKMGEEGRGRVMKLCNSYEYGESCPVAGRLRTNGFRLDGWMDMDEESVRLRKTFTDTDGTYVGLFDELSRVNHSCRPNASYNFHLPSLSMHLHAARDIKKGEELFVCYVKNIFAPASERGEYLERGFRMRCTCAACTHHIVSDGNRRMIREAVLKHEEDAGRVVMDLMNGTEGSGANTRAEEYTSRYLDVLRLCESEGVVTTKAYCSLLGAMVMWFVGVGDVENAMGWGRRYARVMQARGEDCGVGVGTSVAVGVGSYEMFCDEERVRGHEKWGCLVRVRPEVSMRMGG